MGKIGDLWVKLGLKKDEFSNGIKSAKSETGGLLQSFKSFKAGAAAVWAAVGVAVVKAADQFAHHSQRFGDAWDKTTAGMKQAWNAFLTSLTNWDWDNFGERIRNAFKGGSELAAAKDATFEVQNSLKIRKAAMADELAILQVQMRNQNLSYQEREAAARKYLSKVKPLYDEEIKMRKSVMEAEMNAFLGNANIAPTDANRKELERFLTQFAPNEAMTNALSRGEGVMAQIARQYIGQNDDATNELVDAIAAFYQSGASFNEETRRVQNMANSAAAQLSKEVEETAAPELKDLSSWLQREEDQWESVIDKWESANEKLTESFMELADVEIDMSAADDIVNALAEMTYRAQDLAMEFSQNVARGFSEGCQELADQLFGLSETNPGAVVAALLTPLADMAIKAGEIIMAEGIAVEAAKTALASFAGIGAIAAGAALVAAGAAVKSGLSALSQGASASGTASTYSGSTSNATNQNINTEMTIYVKGKLSGSDIVIAGQKTLTNWSR